MRLLTLATAATLALAPVPSLADSHADPIATSLQNALDAYADGDLQYALDELAYAEQLLNALKAEGLAEFLPEPMDGWTMTLNEEAGAAMGFMGGGSIASGDYSGNGDASACADVSSASFNGRVAEMSVDQAPVANRACTSVTALPSFSTPASRIHWLSQNPSIRLSMKMNWPISLSTGGLVASRP